jgi:tetrahydromethanopterin S-methyltransferase subunit G
LNDIAPKRLRLLRDHVLKHVYENGASRPGWSVPLDGVEQALKITRQEVRAVFNLLLSQGLLTLGGSVGSIGINAAGQAEAERLGVLVPMTEPMVTNSTGSATGQLGANAVGESTAAAVGRPGDAARVDQAIPEVRQFTVQASPSAQYVLSGTAQSISIFQEARVTVTDTPESNFNRLMARVTALETSLSAIRSTAPGFGHNKGPQDFEPADAADLIEVDELIALLKQQSPRAVTSREELTAATEKAGTIADKIKEYLDIAFTKMAEEIGKQLGRAPLWYGLWATLTLVAAAAAEWLGSVPF